MGIDEEFFESVLVPQVMIYGFLGFTPQPGGLRIDPHLPKDWQALTITRIAVQDSVIDVTARPDGVEINCRAGSTKPLGVVLAPAQWQLALTDAAGHGTTQTTTHTVKTSGDRIPLTLQTGQQAKFTRR